MRHTYYTCDRCGRSSLSTAGIVVLAAESYTQDEIDHDPDLDNMSGDEITVHLCPICWGKVKRMIESKRVADPQPFCAGRPAQRDRTAHRPARADDPQRHQP
jgi:endogenous inhibitor of DNA gyrase (YacG/DUF329 family)